MAVKKTIGKKGMTDSSDSGVIGVTPIIPTVVEPKIPMTSEQELLYKMEVIEKECGGISNIGMTSDYWVYLNQYRLLLSSK